MHRLRALTVAGMLVWSCGDSSPQEAVQGRCERLNDPARTCRFVGAWTRGEWQSADAVRVGATDDVGSFELTTGQVGRRPEYRFWSFGGLSETELSASGQLIFIGGDVTYPTNMHVELLDDGLALRVTVVSGELLGGSTFTGTYVGR